MPVVCPDNRWPFRQQQSVCVLHPITHAYTFVCVYIYIYIYIAAIIVQIWIRFDFAHVIIIKLFFIETKHRRMHALSELDWQEIVAFWKLLVKIDSVLIDPISSELYNLYNLCIISIIRITVNLFPCSASRYSERGKVQFFRLLYYSRE